MLDLMTYSRAAVLDRMLRCVHIVELHILKGWHKENNISVNVRADPTSCRFLTKSDIFSLSAGCHRAENDR